MGPRAETEGGDSAETERGDRGETSRGDSAETERQMVEENLTLLKELEELKTEIVDLYEIRFFLLRRLVYLVIYDSGKVPRASFAQP